LNELRFIFLKFKVVFLLGLMVSPILPAHGQTMVCGADFFEKTDFNGKHIFVKGPTQLDSLTDVYGDDWDKLIRSIRTGPNTKLIVYQNPKFKLLLNEEVKTTDLLHAWGSTEQDIKENANLIFKENVNIRDLKQFNFEDKIRALRIECD
jgi:hypothetical protein